MSRRAALALLVALAGLLVGVDRPPNLLDVKDLRHWSYPDYTRVVIELSGEAALKGTPQMLPPADGRPERLYLDLEGVWVGTRYARGRAGGRRPACAACGSARTPSARCAWCSISRTTRATACCCSPTPTGS